MSKCQKVAELVKQAYENSTEDFGIWMWKNHVPIVALKTEELSKRFNANYDIAVAGAWLHDFGDAFMHRFADDHEKISRKKGTEILKLAEYSEQEIEQVMKEVIEPHSCKEGHFPTTIEGKVMSAGDALAHLTTDFYVQFAWKNFPQGKSYPEFLNWVEEKLERDFNYKISFEELREEVRYRYEALKQVFLSIK